MDFIIVNNAHGWLYRRRHPIWFGYVEPVVSMLGVGLMLAGLFALEALGVLILGVAVVLPFVR